MRRLAVLLLAALLAPAAWASYESSFGIKPVPGTAMVLQKRAYTSPIWYTP